MSWTLGIRSGTFGENQNVLNWIWTLCSVTALGLLVSWFWLNLNHGCCENAGNKVVFVFGVVLRFLFKIYSLLHNKMKGFYT